MNQYKQLSSGVEGRLHFSPEQLVAEQAGARDQSQQPSAPQPSHPHSSLVAQHVAAHIRHHVKTRVHFCIRPALLKIEWSLCSAFSREETLILYESMTRVRERRKKLLQKTVDWVGERGVYQSVFWQRYMKKEWSSSSQTQRRRTKRRAAARQSLMDWSPIFLQMRYWFCLMRNPILESDPSWIPMQIMNKTWQMLMQQMWQMSSSLFTFHASRLNQKKNRACAQVDTPIISRNFMCLPHPFTHFIVHSTQLFRGFSSPTMYPYTATQLKASAKFLDQAGPVLLMRARWIRTERNWMMSGAKTRPCACRKDWVVSQKAKAQMEGTSWYKQLPIWAFSSLSSTSMELKRATIDSETQSRGVMMKAQKRKLTRSALWQKMPTSSGSFLLRLIQQVSPMLRLMMSRYPQTKEKIVAKPMPTVRNSFFCDHQRLITMMAPFSSLQRVLGTICPKICPPSLYSITTVIIYTSSSPPKTGEGPLFPAEAEHFCLEGKPWIVVEIHRIIIRMDSDLLRQEIEFLVKKKVECLTTELKEEVAKTKEALRHQANNNKNQERDKKRIQEDLSLLRMVVIEQKGAIEKLKQEVSLLKRNNRFLPTNNQLSALTLKRSFIVNDFPKEITSLKEGRKSANAERDSSISDKLKKYHFSASKHNNNPNINNTNNRNSHNINDNRNSHNTNNNNSHNSNNPTMERTVNVRKEDGSPRIGESFSQLTSLLKSGQMSNSLRDTLMRIGQELKNSNNLKESLKYYMKANEVCLKLKQEQLITQAEISFWIACNLSELGNYNEAIRYYLDELALRETMNEIRSENVAATLNNIGHNYYRKQDYPKAVEYFQKAAEMQIHLKGRYDSSVALYLKNLAEVFFVQEDYKLAEQYCCQSLEVYQKIGEVEGEYNSWCHYFLSVIYFKGGRPGDCLKEILESGKAFVLKEKKGQFKEMLHWIARKCEEQKEMMNLVLQAANVLFERHEVKESFRHR